MAAIVRAELIDCSWEPGTSGSPTQVKGPKALEQPGHKLVPIQDVGTARQGFNHSAITAGPRLVHFGKPELPKEGSYPGCVSAVLFLTSGTQRSTKREGS